MQGGPHMQTLQDIWQRRYADALKYYEENKWNGDKPKYGFCIPTVDDVDPHQLYGDNWNDLMIKDFRHILTQLSEGQLSNVLSGFDFKVEVQCTDHISHYILLTKRPVENHICITAHRVEDQSYFIIKTDFGVFSVSWYKHRGRIDSILNLEYGSSITLEELTDILIYLGLEQPYENID